MAISRHARCAAQVLLMLTIAVLAVTGLINWLLPAGPTFAIPTPLHPLDP